MVNTSKQTPLTVENFRELLMPEINKQFNNVYEEIKSVRGDLTKEIKSVRGDLTKEIKSVRGDLTKEIKSVRGDLTKLAHTVNSLKETVEETNEKVKFLPTTEIYLASQDKLMGELKKSTEVTSLTGQHYEDTNTRIDEIDRYLNINSRLAIG